MKLKEWWDKMRFDTDSRETLDSELPEIEEVNECRGCGGRINPDYGRCRRCE